MSTWETRAQDAAVVDRHALYDEGIDGVFFGGFGNESDAQDFGFRYGARWQREALLSDETVDRVAQAIYESAPNNWSWTWEQIVDGWKNKPYPDYPHLVDDMRRQAMAALTAAIGDDHE